jgi:F-type H+-transporting ATPase subunit c
MRIKVFAVVSCVALVMLMSGLAFAQGTTGLRQEPHASTGMGWAMALGIGIAAGLAALGQSNAIRGAVESVARQPEAGGRLQTMMLIGVVFIETLVIFTWVLLFLWGGNVFTLPH